MVPATSAYLTDALINYTLHLADNSLILGHRNSEWTGHGPILEQDIALTNIALDQIGQARNFYQYAATLVNEYVFRHDQATDATEDTLAYLRDAGEFRNILLVEQPNGDWAKTILRQFLFSAFAMHFLPALRQGNNSNLSAIAEKSLKEVTYHLRWSAEWVIRLGDGTTESHDRIQRAATELWMYTGEFFQPAAYENEAAIEGYGVDLRGYRKDWQDHIKNIFDQATLSVPGDCTAPGHLFGKEGRHTPCLAQLLEEMQCLQREYPDSQW